MARLDAAQCDDRNRRQSCQRGEARRTQRLGTGMGPRRKERRDQHGIRSSPNGRAQLPHVMHRRAMQPARARRPRANWPATRAMMSIRPPGSCERRIARQQEAQTTPPRGAPNLHEQGLPIGRRESVMPQHHRRSARQARNRARQIARRHPLVRHQPDAGYAPARFALALPHGASYSGADEWA